MKNYKEIWMTNYENFVIRDNPELAGKIDWYTAIHLYNTGITAMEASLKIKAVKS